MNKRLLGNWVLIGWELNLIIPVILNARFVRFLTINCKKKSNQRLMRFALVRKIINEVIENGTLKHVISNNCGGSFFYPRFKDVLPLCAEKDVCVWL